MKTAKRAKGFGHVTRSAPAKRPQPRFDGAISRDDLSAGSLSVVDENIAWLRREHRRYSRLHRLCSWVVLAIAMAALLGVYGSRFLDAAAAPLLVAAAIAVCAQLWAQYKTTMLRRARTARLHERMQGMFDRGWRRGPDGEHRIAPALGARPG
ncbi:MAG: hypothetical protein AAF909_06335 [Pseudomonadota bacterium]